MLNSLYRGMIVLVLCALVVMIYDNKDDLMLEPDFGAAKGDCYLNLVESEPLVFGAIVANASSATWISMDTDSMITAQRSKSFVGNINSENYQLHRGVVSLSGKGLAQGSQIIVTFNTAELSDGIALDNMQFDVATVDNLVAADLSGFQSLTLNVLSEGRVQADILFSGRLTLQKTVYGQVNEDLVVEGSWECS